MQRLISTIILLCCTSTAWAMFCPNNFNTIQAGAPLEQVKALCGKPLTEKKTTTTQSSAPQEWNYYITPNPLINNGDLNSYKTVIDFKNNQVIYISVNGVAVNSAATCGQAIQIGSTVKDVTIACGTPASIRKDEDPDPNATVSNKVTTLTYKDNTGATKTFAFLDGKLQ